MICPGRRCDENYNYWTCQRNRRHTGPCWHFLDGVMRVWGSWH